MFGELATVRIVVEFHRRIKITASVTASNCDGIVLVGFVGFEFEGSTASFDREASVDLFKEAECNVIRPFITFAGGESTTAIIDTHFCAVSRLSVDTYSCAAL